MRLPELEKIPDDPTERVQYVIGCENASDWQYGPPSINH